VAPERVAQIQTARWLTGGESDVIGSKAAAEIPCFNETLLAGCWHTICKKMGLVAIA
jgi:hypothetical protein